MTEQEWLACTRPYAMFKFCRERPSERKRRLFCVACCRRIPTLADDKACVGFVDLLEQCAEGSVPVAVVVKSRIRGASHAHTALWDACHGAWGVVSTATIRAVLGKWTWEAEEANAERNAHCALLRHIVGNPFRALPRVDHWPSHVTRLAGALYEGADCGFALHDALLEAGHPGLAEHFQKETAHPKGCWVVDLVLGKT